MRMCAMILAATMLAACGPPPPCVDEDGNELNVCTFGDDELEFCPGDHWASEDACFSYSCSNAGEVLETQNQCEQ